MSFEKHLTAPDGRHLPNITIFRALKKGSAKSDKMIEESTDLSTLRKKYQSVVWGTSRALRIFLEYDSRDEGYKKGSEQSEASLRIAIIGAFQGVQTLLELEEHISREEGCLPFGYAIKKESELLSAASIYLSDDATAAVDQRVIAVMNFYNRGLHCAPACAA